MGNSKRGAIPFKAYGDQHTMRISINGMVRYEDLFGERMFDAVQRLDEGEIDLRRLRNLFYITVDGGPDWDIEAAGDMIDEVGLARSGELLGEAVMAAFPDAKGEDEAPAEDAAKGQAQGNGKTKAKAKPEAAST